MTGILTDKWRGWQAVLRLWLLLWLVWRCVTLTALGQVPAGQNAPGDQPPENPRETQGQAAPQEGAGPSASSQAQSQAPSPQPAGPPVDLSVQRATLPPGAAGAMGEPPLQKAPEGGMPQAQTLTDGPARTMGDGIWQAEGVHTLRVDSPDAGAFAVLHFRRMAGPQSPWRLHLILVGRQDSQEFRYKGLSQVARDERLERYRHYRLDEGVETGLMVEGAPVREIRVIDDGQGEPRISREGGVLHIALITPEFGGQPSGNNRPHYFGRDLRAMDYNFIGGLYTDNGWGEIFFMDTFRLSGVYLNSGGKEAYLGRAEVTRQAWRGETMALWLHGGGAIFQVNPGGPPDSDETWVGGLSWHMRFGDWGLVVEGDQVDEDTFLALTGGWGGWDVMGFHLYWQSYQGLSGYGLGIYVDL